MSRFNETMPSNTPGEMLLLEHYPLIPVEEQEANINSETWLFVLKSREVKLALPTFKNESPFPALANSTINNDSPFSAIANSTINIKDSQWLDGLDAADILLREDPDTPVENDQTKIIDTRTFTRPRKSRMSSSPFQPAKETIMNTTMTTTTNTTINLNSTFNYSIKETCAKNGDLLNATVVIEDAVSQDIGELNATFPVNPEGILNGDGSPVEQLVTPNNNNVYLLNNTFTADAESIHLPTKNVPLNATYSEDEPVQGPTANIRHRDSSLEDMEELEEDDRIEDEAVFRRPLLPDGAPKKSFLIRTSTLNSDTPVSKNASDNISPPVAYDMERLAKQQEESLAQTSTPMGQRKFPPHRRPIEIDHNLGSPISSLAGPAHEGTVNFGPPIPISSSLASNHDSNSDSSTQIVRGHLTFEKSQNSVEAQSSSPSSPIGSPYSSQSIESDGAGCGAPPTPQDMLRRSMPNLNNASRLRMPQPSSTLAASGNLNRQHGSETGLRPPSSSGIRPPVGRVINGPLSFRPQLPVPETTAIIVPNAVKPSQPQQQQPTRSAMPPPRNSLLPASSRLKQPQLIAPSRASVGGNLHPPLARASAPSDDLNSTVVVGKPVILKPSAVPQPTAVAAPVFSGIPRPSMVSRIPGPRTMLKSSIPTMGFRPRAPQ